MLISVATLQASLIIFELLKASGHAALLHLFPNVPKGSEAVAGREAHVDLCRIDKRNCGALHQNAPTIAVFNMVDS
jgi:hypothetical protein